MKIGIISDLHIDYGRTPQLSGCKEGAVASLLDEVDCLVMCGDNAEPNHKLGNQRRLFDTLRSKSNKPMAFVTGNHDLIGHILRKGVTIGEIRNRFRQYSSLAGEYGIVHLEHQNLAAGDITICGTYGHYDGTLSGTRFPEDYNTVFQLVTSLKQRARATGKKILVTHSVPNKGLIGHPDGPIQRAYMPFSGSFQLEDVIRMIRPEWHFCGHTHAYAHSEIGRTKSYNIGTDYGDFFYFVLNTSDSSIVRLEKRLC